MVSIRTTFAQFLWKKAQIFSFVVLRFCANFMARKIGLFRFCAILHYKFSAIRLNKDVNCIHISSLIESSRIITYLFVNFWINLQLFDSVLKLSILANLQLTCFCIKIYALRKFRKKLRKNLLRFLLKRFKNPNFALKIWSFGLNSIGERGAYTRVNCRIERNILRGIVLVDCKLHYSTKPGILKGLYA